MKCFCDFIYRLRDRTINMHYNNKSVKLRHSSI